VNQQPNSRMCFGCGLENRAGLRLRFFDNGKDQVVADFTIEPQHQGYPGLAHGGIVAAILDEIGGRTAMIGSPQRFFVTAKMEIKYRQPVPVGRPLRTIGWLIRRRGRLTSARAQIRTLEGVVLAEARLLLTDLPPSVAAADPSDRLGWRVYPPGASSGAADNID